MFKSKSKECSFNWPLNGCHKSPFDSRDYYWESRTNRTYQKEYVLYYTDNYDYEQKSFYLKKYIDQGNMQHEC